MGDLTDNSFKVSNYMFFQDIQLERKVAKGITSTDHRMWTPKKNQQITEVSLFVLQSDSGCPDPDLNGWMMPLRACQAVRKSSADQVVSILRVSVWWFCRGWPAPVCNLARSSLHLLSWFILPLAGFVPPSSALPGVKGSVLWLLNNSNLGQTTNHMKQREQEIERLVSG